MNNIKALTELEWFDTRFTKPYLTPLSPHTNCARSSFVLGAFSEDGDLWFEVTLYSRGGRGDDCTLHWWTDMVPKWWAHLDDVASTLEDLV